MKKLSLFLTLPSIIGALPNNLQNGTTADATQVMADFNWIVNQVNANAAPLADTALKDANNNFTAVQSGINATDRTNFPLSGQVQDFAFNTLSSTLGTNTITGRIAGMTISGYASGQVFTFVPTQTNTGPVTLNIDGVAARPILLAGTNAPAGTLRQLIPVAVRFQDPAFHILSNGSPIFISAGDLATTTKVPLAPNVGLKSLNNDFTNLTNVDQNINNAVSMGQGTFFCTLLNIDGDLGSFMISAGLEFGVGWKYVGTTGGGAAVAEGAEGVFAITGLGDGRTYTITCNTSTGAWKIQSDSLATGTTRLTVCGVSNAST